MLEDVGRCWKMLGDVGRCWKMLEFGSGYGFSKLCMVIYVVAVSGELSFWIDERIYCFLGRGKSRDSSRTLAMNSIVSRAVVGQKTMLGQQEWQVPAVTSSTVRMG